jgi:formate-dependent nitrite reductase membrane component NrfD
MIEAFYNPGVLKVLFIASGIALAASIALAIYLRLRQDDDDNGNDFHDD